MNLDQGWPLVLSSAASLPGQTTKLPSQLALANPMGEPFKIHEVRFSLTSSTARLTGATFGCKLDLGAIAITNGFIPVWNFGRVISRDQDIGVQFSWRLKYPIYVPAGGIMSAGFQNFGQSSDGEVTGRITYFCSSAARQRPTRVFLPWVSVYAGKTFPYETADTDVSRETDLLNPFDADLHVSRLIGRINVFTPSTNGNDSVGIGSQLLDTRVSLSNGDPLVRTPTPFQQVFGQEGRAWEQRNTILKAKQFFQVYIDKLSTTDSAPNFTIQPFVSLVGYRELKLLENK